MSKKEKSLDDIDRFIFRVADKQDWGVNKDPEFLDHIKKGLQTTYNRHGYFLCPCRDGAGDREADKDIVCPCVYNVPDQKEHGHCFCGLFFDKTYEEEGGDFKQIPDRRPDEFYD